MTTSRRARLLRAARRGWRATAEDLRDQDDQTVRDASGVQRRLYLPPVEERDRSDFSNCELAGVVTTLRGMSDAELRRLRRRIIVEGALLAGLFCLAPALSFGGRSWLSLLYLANAGFILYGTVWRWRIAAPYRLRPRMNLWEAPKEEVVRALLRHDRCPSCGQCLAGLPPSPEGRLICPECGGTWRRDGAAER